MHSAIASLNEAGQSIWYDNLSRDVLRSGELKRIIAAGVTGLTSNPTIFKKAIADTADYDDDIVAAMQEKVSTEELTERLMVRDVQAAADLLLPVFKQSKGADGYASIEVSPFLAHDSMGTITSARLLWAKVARSNVMVKVPATREGIPAIRALLSEGINVNVTLIFSIAVYAQVAEAYLSALEERLSNGQDLSRITSVASFFVSRVDAASEARLEKLNAAEALARLRGRVGIANSKKAYARFEEIVASPRFARLREAGAKVQRPLWASTGIKNPQFDALHYVWPLAGRDTVNTMPPATLTSLLASAPQPPGLRHGMQEADRTLDELARAGVALDEVTAELQHAGVELFAASYRDLLKSVGNKSQAVAA